MLSDAQLDDLRERNPIAQVAADLGVKLTRGRFGPCPICGGSSKNQRFEIKRGGKWVCAVCQDGGDVIRLVERVRGVSFRDAVEWLGGAREFDPVEAERRAQLAAQRRRYAELEAAKYREAERARLYKTWQSAAPLAGSPYLAAYLSGRAIEYHDGLTLRCLADAPYFEGEVRDDAGRRSPRVIHRGPAMLAAFVDAGGRFLGLHFTWIDPARPGQKAQIFDPETGEPLVAKKMRGHKQGGLLKLQAGGDATRVRVGEGIETTLSLRDALRDGALYFAAGDLGNLAGAATASVAHPSKKSPAGRAIRVPGPQPDLGSEAVPIPSACAQLWLIKDGDSDPITTDFAMLRARDRHARPGRILRVLDPPAGLDFNDMLRAAE